MVAGDTTPGQRRDVAPHEMAPGDYGRWPKTGEPGDHGWWCKTPSGHGGNLNGHEVTEHEDGTITVSPSILVTSARRMVWHGYLERGVWREV